MYNTVSLTFHQNLPVFYRQRVTDLNTLYYIIKIAVTIN